MKKLLIIAALVTAFAAGSFITPNVNAAVEGITAENYDTYVKPNEDPRYGYNKGEADKPYLEGEEQFYNEDYDHWNVDEVYDPDLVKEADELCGDEEIAEEVITEDTIEAIKCPYCGKELE